MLLTPSPLESQRCQAGVQISDMINFLACKHNAGPALSKRNPLWIADWMADVCEATKVTDPDFWGNSDRRPHR
ncbi:hypothetical protein PoB_007243700 [Plakobranchus ocellatus]|uniref:Uncharacterized protein n=1 Tax=Plakobranchus ocellatus TaxID=259542 RepID=A0AAV4DNK3_9GAST|nr:hypothetical protein PoB_007243700 [Plakobranchus ocellatus]